MRAALATTKMSSRGQVVIPQDVRAALNLGPGAQFVVLGQDDVVMLKVIEPPSLGNYAELRRRLNAQVRALGLKKKDIGAAIKRVRSHR